MSCSLGPWSAQQSDNNEYEWEVIHNERYIAVVCDEPGYNGTAEANAHLIAAAPELLEALELCANVLAGHDMSKFALTRALEKSRDALAKAKGQ